MSEASNSQTQEAQSTTEASKTQDNNQEQTRSQESERQATADAGKERQQQQRAKDDQEDGGYWRRQAEQREKKIKELERATLSESERLKLERDEYRQKAEQYEARIKDHDMKARFERAASKAGLIDADLAYMVVRDKLTLSEDGKVIGLDGAIADLRRHKPYLFENQGKLGSGGGNTGSRATGNGVNGQMNSMIRRASGR